jgi:hypothetical protein
VIKMVARAANRVAEEVGAAPFCVRIVSGVQSGITRDEQTPLDDRERAADSRNRRPPPPLMEADESRCPLLFCLFNVGCNTMQPETIKLMVEKTY